MKEWTSSMSIEETKAILFRAQELRELGRKEEAIALQKKVPVDPGFAEDIKRWDKEGFQILLKEGFNLKDVIAKFGEKWLYE